jgi:RNA polymerase sigma-70 factor (ECF subfamily)
MTIQRGTDDEDRQWLAAWRAGDETSARALYDRHAASVTRFFATKLSRKDDVKALVHDTFLQLHRSTTAIEHSVRAFVFGVARNVLRHYLRDRSREQRRTDQLRLAPEGSPIVVADIDPIDPEACFGARQEHRLVGKSLRRLTLDDQVVLELFYWQDLPRVEIAAIFAVPEGTMAGRIAAARKRLAAKMAELSRSVELLESTSKTYTTWLVELQAHIAAMKPPPPRGGGGPEADCR